MDADRAGFRIYGDCGGSTIMGKPFLCIVRVGETTLVDVLVEVYKVLGYILRTKS